MSRQLLVPTLAGSFGMTDDTTLEVRRGGHSVTVRLNRRLDNEALAALMDLIFQIVDAIDWPEEATSITGDKFKFTGDPQVDLG